MPGIFGDTMGIVENQLRFRLARQSVLATNVANADTPGYRRAELRFDQVLARATRPLAATNPRHATGDTASRPGWRLEVERAPAGPDGNSVNLDREIIELNRNAGAFTEQTAVLSRLHALRRMAMEEGR